MFNTEKTAEKIRRARIEKNLTQTGLADLMGVSFQAVSNWERGNSMPDISKLDDLCRILDVDLYYLLGSSEGSEAVNGVLENGGAEVDIGSLTEIAPMVEPEKLKNIVEEKSKKRKLSFEELCSIAPFVDRGTVDECVKEIGQIDDPEALFAIAPFVSKEVFSEIFDRCTERGEIEMELLVGMAPFVDREILDKRARDAKFVDMQELSIIAPFISRGTLDTLVEKLGDGAANADISDVSRLAPFISREKANELIRKILKK